MPRVTGTTPGGTPPGTTVTPGKRNRTRYRNRVKPGTASFSTDRAAWGAIPVAMVASLERCGLLKPGAKAEATEILGLQLQSHGFGIG